MTNELPTGWKGTQGPWAVQKGRTTLSARSLGMAARAGRNGRLIAGYSFGQSPTDEQISNMRGIAAVPELIEALLPFARLAQSIHEDAYGFRLIPDGHRLTVGDIRRAAAALTKAGVTL